MKIGLLFNNYTNLANWELRIIEEIMVDPKLELSLIIQYPQIERNSSNIITNTISRVKFNIFKIQLLIERKIFAKHVPIGMRNTIMNRLKNIPHINLCHKKNDTDELMELVDSIKIGNLGLDIIFSTANHTFNNTLAKLVVHGVWCFSYGSKSSNSSFLAGFWEIYSKKPVVTVQLLKVSQEFKANDVIDNAYFNRHWSFVKTNREVLEGSVSLLMKNLRIQELIDPLKIMDNQSHILIVNPGIAQLIKYTFRFYLTLFIKSYGRIITHFFGIRYHCWTLFLGKGNFLTANISTINPVELPKDEFWADPFIFNYKNVSYVFFENYSYKTKLGKISCGIIHENKLKDVVDVLDLPYHLSYPFIFEEDGEIYLMPETAKNKRLEIYKCKNFPSQWELYSTAFEGEMVADATFYTDKLKEKWLFVNKKVATTTMESELYIYKVDSLKFNKIESHRMNPVLIDSKRARNGGAIFEYDGELLRPSQGNIDGIYGKTLNIGVINKLTMDEYIEDSKLILDSSFQKGFKAVHHLHQFNNMFVFDAAYYKK